MRFGLLGTGYWAAHTHAAAIAAHPHAELTAVWGRDPQKAAALAAEHGARAHEDLDALLAEVDAVAVALPPDVQAPLAVRAARAGRHLLLDKPLALTLADADAVVDAVDRAGVASLVFFTNRFCPPAERFLTEAGAQGGWEGARLTTFASIFQPGNPYGASPWRREHGGLWDIGPHALAQLLPVLGPGAEVTALPGPRGAVHLLLRHESGAVSTLALGLDAQPAAVTHELAFFGAAGWVRPPDRGLGPVEAYGVAVDALLRNAREGLPDRRDVRFGREVVAVLEAASASLREGRAQLLRR